MAEFKLGRIRFVWKEQWTTGTTYFKDDIVHYGGKTFLCVIGHTSNADFYTDLDNVPTRWNQFSDGQSWKGDWSNTTLYKVNDIVKYGGYVYICNTGHTSQSTLEADQSKWDIFAESLDWKGDWTISTFYKVNDLVKYGARVYICNQAHTSNPATTTAPGTDPESSTGLEADQSKWDIFSTGVEWKGNWTTGTRYKVGDLVKYGGTTYVCNTAHTSAASAASGLENNQSSWDFFNQGIEYKGQWASAQRYKINDVVKNGAGTWICVTIHTSSGNFVTDVANWNQFVEGFEFEGFWSAGTTYQPGDLVKYGGNSYIAKTAHISATSFEPSTNSTDWDLFATGFIFVEDWSGTTGYKVGEVVKNNGYLYLATADSLNQKPPNVAYWILLTEGIQWRGDWANTTVYELGDSIKYGPNSYICVQGHTSNSGTNRPDVDITGSFWNLLTAGNEESALTTTGDLVFYGGSGPTRLPVGDEGQVLTVESGLPSWQYFGQTDKVYYVSPTGINQPAPTYGLTIDKPWASVRYGLEQIDKGTEYPEVAGILDLNRAFIQKEIVEWTDYQIANNIAPFTTGFTYDKAFCQRDMGLLVDALIYDVTHTGNFRSIEVAEAYFTPLGVSYILGQEDETVASINYGLDLIIKILDNEAPVSNYQTLNGIGAGDRIKQIFITPGFSVFGAAEAYNRIADLTEIITSAILAGNLDDLPVLDIPNFTLNVKTGEFYEVLPMIVPANTAIVGDELRSTRIGPAFKIIPTNDKAKSVGTLNYLRSITEDIITNTAITPTTGNSETQDTTSQKAGSVGNATAVTRVENRAAIIKDILENGEGAAPAYSNPDPTGYGSTLIASAYASSGNGSGNTTGYDNARSQLTVNKTFIMAEITAWIEDQIATVTAPFTANFVYDSMACERDVGLIIDAVVYDITYGGNTQTKIAADAYYSYGIATFGEGEKLQTLAAYVRLQSVISDVILENIVATSPNNLLTQDTSGTAGSAGSANFASERIQDIIDVITVDGDVDDINYPSTVSPDTSWVSSSLVASRNNIISYKSKIRTDSVQYIKTQYPTLNFNLDTCSRDVGFILDAIGFDIMFDSNFASIKAGLAYYRGTLSAQLVVAEQKSATADIIDYIGFQTSFFAANGAAVTADIIWEKTIDAVDNLETRPLIAGANEPTIDLDIINGAKIFKLNKNFIVAEATAWIQDTYSATVTASSSSTDEFTCSDGSWMVTGDQVRFYGTVFGGISTGVTYYVVTAGNNFSVSTTLGGAAIPLQTASGTMEVRYYYNVSECENDVSNYVDSIAYDMLYTGNYKSSYAARYYINALTGSRLEDMFYVKNGCGIRNQTLFNLDGSSDGNLSGQQDPLTPANEFGTSRPKAGAYVSLDPGWGPNDFRAWVTNKSTYVQNVTTFGTGCVGQKIDGVLHNGGNDSIVSNDFTQVLSDGIGAWITNLGRAELVSVFSYYNHIGYLAENGGKIRATNGNNSYGDFGSVSEGIDVTEIPVTGQIDNRNAQADVRSVLVNGNNVLALEFGNAGSEYNRASVSISGSGANASAIAEDFRDGAVFQVRLTDPGDSSGPGGENYITAANLAQAGTSTQITLAAADIQPSGFYNGMAIYILIGTGAGQYGYIDSYNGGSKVAQIYKPSTGTPGWDHVISGTPIASALDVTTSYEITPRIEFSDPPFIKTRADLPASNNWSDVVYGDAYAEYSSVAASGGSGSLAQFDVTRRYGNYSVSIAIPGVLYQVGEQLTILGTSLGGDTPANDLTLTIVRTSGASGGVLEVSASGAAVSPKYVAIASGSTSGAYSVDGENWTSMTMPTATGPGLSNQWVAVTYGVYNNEGRYVAVARESSASAYSLDGINWTATNLNEVADWTDIASGNGIFVSIAESDSSTTFRSVSTDGGVTWSSGSLPSGATAIAFGANRFVVVEGNFSNSAAFSTNGIAWTTSTLPANDDSAESNWVDIAYGNNRFVAISDSSAAAAYSFNGSTWFASTLPSTIEWSSVRYGQGVFFATSYTGEAASSPDGVLWTSRDISYAEIDIIATSQDTNPGAYSASTLPDSADWTAVTWTGNKFIAVGNNVSGAGDTAYAASSTDGETWTSVTVPQTLGNTELTTVAYNGSNKYVAFISNTRNLIGSTDGVTWTLQNTNGVNNSPISRLWIGSVYGDKFVVIASVGVNSVIYSSDGNTWTQGSGFATTNTWSGIAYGDIGGTDYYVAVSGSQTSAYSTNGISWTSGTTLPSSDVWSSVAYGNGRFVTVAGDSVTTTTKAAYSTDGITWTAATMPGAAARWVSITYGGGAFTAFAYNSNRTAYSTDGITWIEGPSMSSSTNWNISAYGNDRNVVLSTLLSDDATSLEFILDTNRLTTSSTTTLLNVNDRIRFIFDSTGAEIFGGVDPNRVYFVSSIDNQNQFTISEQVGGAKFVLSTGTGSMLAITNKTHSASAFGNSNSDPRWVVIGEGSQGLLNIHQGTKPLARAYVLEEQLKEIWIRDPGSGYITAPTITITDPNNIGAEATSEVRIGNGAIGPLTFLNRGISYTAASATILGDGFADNYQVGSFVGVKNLTDIPKEGSNITIAGIDDVFYRLVNVTGLILRDDGTYTATLQLSPAVGVAEAPEHETAVTGRRRYSQVRLTGHDFLDIGTGNFIQTNYPGLPFQDPIPANETILAQGGRVFWTSTDQDGNFRVGGLFNVEQSTGVATLNADAFNIAGLNELSLGSVALGGSGATITEFSTDPFFTQDSDSIVPTQRAIKAYITSQIGGGGSSLNVNTLTAGIIYIAGQSISTTTNQQIDINTKVNFKGGIVGSALVLNYFLLNN